MSSGIDARLPADERPASKADLRRNLASAKAELEHAGFFERDASAAVQRLGAHKLEELVSPQDFGALADGESHPVTEWLVGGVRDRGYADLAAIQADYPHVDQLTAEIDWAALQAAIDEVAARGGGTVFVPRGRYRIDRTITLPLRDIFPYNDGVQVNLVGEGEHCVWLDWTTDLGAERYAIDFAVRGRDDWQHQAEIRIEKLILIGPDFRGDAPALARAGARMHGIHLIDRVGLDRVHLYGFFAGLDVEGGQTKHTRVLTYGCYYGLYLRRRNTAHHGDTRYERCWFSGRMAAVGIGPDNGVLGTHFDTVFFGGTPFVFFKEAGVGGLGHEDLILDAALFTNCQFERIGNAIVWEDNPQPYKSIRNASFDHCFFLADTRYQDPGRPRTALFRVGRIDGLQLRQPGGSWEPGTRAMFEIFVAAQRVDLHDADRLLARCTATDVPLVHSALQNPSEIRLRGGSWEGIVVRVSQVVEVGIASGEAVGQREDGVDRADGSTVVRGIAMGGGARSGAAETNIPVATCGSAVAQTDRLRPGVYVKVDESQPGRAKQADGPDDGQVIGVATGQDTVVLFPAPLASRRR